MKKFFGIFAVLLLSLIVMWLVIVTLQKQSEVSIEANVSNLDETSQGEQGRQQTSDLIDSSQGPVIYLSFASHNEDEFHPDYPNFIQDEDAFWESRSNLIAYAQMLVSHGVQYDFQTDWNFLLAVQAYDQGDESTNGKNVIRYLHEDLGVDIDPHSHENGGYNFVDVAYLISELGVEPTGVVGGFIAGPPESSQLDYFWSLRTGLMYPSATWTPEILWGGGTGQHQNESDYWISGVWYPKSATEFDVHDPTAPLPNVGNNSGTWDAFFDLLEALQDGELDPEGFYTATIMINQSEMDEANRQLYESYLLEVASAVAQGDVIYSTITNTFIAWETTQDGEPTIHHTSSSADTLEEPPFKKPLKRPLPKVEL